MITAKAIATVVAMVLVGFVLRRALAMRLLVLDNPQSESRPIPEPDLFLLGLLPGLADRHNRSDRTCRSTTT